MLFSVYPPLVPGNSGPAVANLGRVLSVLIDHQVVRSLVAPDRPTAEELASLYTLVQDEVKAAVFGAGIQETLRFLQFQQGMGESLRGIVEKTTADLLNQLVLGFGDSAPETLQLIRSLQFSLSVKTKRFSVDYQLDGESKTRTLELNPGSVTALLGILAHQTCAYDAGKSCFVSIEALPQ